MEQTLKNTISNFYRVTTAQPMGAYKATEIDTAKENADIRIVAADTHFTLISKISLSGRGINRHTDQIYYVSEKALEAIRAKHNVVCDF